MIKNNHKGFTLVELIVVIVILGILAVVVIPAFSSYSKKAQESTCATTRRTLLGELSAENLFDEEKTLELISETTPAGIAYLKKAKCPADGMIAVDDDEILCSKHGKTISEKGLISVFHEIIDSWDDKTMGHGSNDNYRKELYKTQYPDGWPAVVVDGKVLYMQPYLYKPNKPEEGKDYYTIFANTNKTFTNSWYTSAVYDNVGKKWYVSNGGGFSIDSKTNEQVIEKVKELGWKAVD